MEFSLHTTLEEGIYIYWWNCYVTQLDININKDEDLGWYLGVKCKACLGILNWIHVMASYFFSGIKIHYKSSKKKSVGNDKRLLPYFFNERIVNTHTYTCINIWRAEIQCIFIQLEKIHVYLSVINYYQRLQKMTKPSNKNIKEWYFLNLCLDANFG